MIKPCHSLPEQAKSGVEGAKLHLKNNGIRFGELRMSELASLSVTVHGRVQGVFYRAFVSRTAKTLGLKGYVRNLPRSNTVELRVEGEKDKLENLLEQLKIGPPEALVEEIETEWSEFRAQFANFEVRY